MNMALRYYASWHPMQASDAAEVLGHVIGDFFDDKLRELRELFGPMLAISQAMCDSFKQELLEGKHNFMVGGNNMKCALYVAAATLGNGTTAYTAANEVANGNGYTTTGKTLTNVNPTLSGAVAFTDFADLAWTASTFTARGALIYNDDAADRAVAVLDFGADKTVTSGTFTIVFPAAAAGTAILRLT